MNIGVFIPIGNNGWLLSENAPQYRPTFELNREIVQRAEHYGFDFALSMIKLRGFGGKTEFWDHNLESFTLMAGLAAVTSRIKLFATAATLTLPPAIVARMAATIDCISGGRFGVNLVTGWQKPEYSQMGLWPGDEFFASRYQYLGEYAQVLRDLWGTGQSDFQGAHFRMEDCRVSPQPQAPMEIVCAGASDAGLAFAAEHADYSFVFGKGVNTPKAFAPAVERLQAATAKTGREVSSIALFMIIAAETDEAARAKWEHYKAGADEEAIAWLGAQAAADTKSGSDTNVRQMADPTSAVNINMGTLVGSFASVARMLDEIAEVPGASGVLLTFDDFVQGVTDFGERIQPLMQSRRHVELLKESA
ncbi:MULTISPECIES: pyrimidine utilization protein A [Pseudomonas]|uniref:Pyrimidine monooxygenase RutA n=1 Tax=Pseudomonas oryzihabitans TaxID=47885 RepID=A0A178LJS5_9PSED|nr:MULTISPECIES: pyrimidine utilization protein A [Pseudomonas]KXJ31340.1 pyrimidine utilization protein A [Pseudomonas sp. HUK17]MDC7831115.1 pyrimidine utilization protein A [Pseudomonas benzopyrenica]NRH44162.1 pyrimidine utilization protein A [Pseudomonas sp. MS15a(2019)]OAN30350.1 pyrimidine utilization protein A [Pseudomonas oryzihabitans]SEP43339.1 pyrimidine oxygenase [Pseudomonas sp. Snoq117.2]